MLGLKANMMADIEDPLEFARKMGVHYPLAIATDDLMQKFGGLEGLPTTLLNNQSSQVPTSNPEKHFAGEGNQEHD